MKKLFTLLIVLFLWAGSSWGQTTLISPTGDGGFETGNTPALNNWVAVNATTDGWVVGNVPVVSAGSNCGYISSNGGAAWTYTQLSTIEHLYYDVTIPVGQPKVTLTFKWKAMGEGSTTSDWDNMKVFFGLSSAVGVPVANTAVLASYQVSGPGAISGMYKLSSVAWNAETILISGTPGSTYRLVFSWKSDGSDIANPPCAIDEVSVVSSVATNITSTSLGGLWSSAATWVGGAVPAGDHATIAAGATVVVNQSVNVGNLVVDGKLQWITSTTPSSSVNLLQANSITVNATGKLYAHATPLLGATIKVTGNFTNDGTVNLAAPSANLTFNGTSGTQTLGGAGTFISDMPGRGMITNLQFISLAACDVATTQNLVTGNLAHTAGSLNTNDKLSIDNTAISFGGLINRSITTVTVNVMGAGYTSAPTVAFTAAPAGGTTATGTANFDAATGTIRSITITNAGDGYRTTPTVTLTGGGFTTAATAVASLYQVFNFGTSSLGQKSAIASVTGGLTIKSDQSVGNVWVTGGGLGYTTAPTVGFSLPTGYLNLVTAGGSGYTSAPTVVFTGGGGTGAVGVAVVTRGQVVSVNITTAGTGYTSAPIISFTGGVGTGATAALPAGALPTATATIDAALGMVTSFTVTNGGFGYTATPTVTLTGGGSTTAATGATARIGLYNLTLSYFAPATSNATHSESVFIPANRRINIFALNSATTFGLNLTGDLELYNSSPFSLSGDLNMGGNTLTFSHPTYTGTSGGTTAFVSNGKITYKLFGATTAQTRLFPFNSYDGISGFNNHLVSMGTAAAVATDGSTITTLSGSMAAAPTGTDMIGTRTLRIQTYGGLYGTLPSVRLNWNAVDALVAQATYLTVAQATATSGPWTVRSIVSGTGTVNPAGGNRTTATTGVGPIVPTGDDYFGWNYALPACLLPTALTVTDLTIKSANLAWTAGGTETAWEYVYGVSPLAVPTGAGTATTSSTVNPITGLTASTSYQYYVRANCGLSFSSWAGPYTFITGYCIPAPISVDGSGITNVNFSTVNNTTGAETGNYGNYSAMVGDAYATVVLTVNITYSTGYTYDTKIWVDWNDDLDFVDAGEDVYTGVSSSSNPTTLAASFLVPGSAILGPHRMRIGGVDSGPPTPCYTADYGSFEDYTINVVTPPTCPPPTTLTTSGITATQVTLGWTETGTATAWEIQYGTLGFTLGTGTIVSAGTNPFTLTGLTPASSNSFYVRAYCSAADQSPWVGPTPFVLPDENIVTLTAIASAYVSNLDKVIHPGLMHVSEFLAASSAADTAGRAAMKFNLSTIPANAIISKVTVNYYQVWNVSSSIANNLYPLANDPSTSTGAALWADCADGLSMWSGAWPLSVPGWYNNTLNSDGIAYVTSKLASGWAGVSIVRGSSNQYNFAGYNHATYKPYMTIDYHVPTTPLFLVTPSVFDFEQVNLGIQSLSKTFTIKNNGVGTLTINSVSLTGADVSQFVFTDANTYPVSLTAGASVTVQVVFKPTSLGAKTASLSIVEATTHTVALSGTGYLNGPQNLTATNALGAVNLAWAAPLPLEEIRYDDNTAETSYWVGTPSTTSQYFYTKITIPVDGTLNSFAVVTTGGLVASTWESVMLCPESAGAPNLAAPIQSFSAVPVAAAYFGSIVENLSSPLAVTAGQNYYIVTQWPAASTDGPYVATDTHNDHQRCAFTSTGGATWTTIAMNFMMRAYMTPGGLKSTSGSITLTSGGPTPGYELLAHKSALGMREGYVSPKEAHVLAPAVVSANPEKSFVNYTVHRGAAAGVYTTTFTGVGTTSYADNTVLPSTLYYYMVSAEYTDGSANSNEVSITSLAACPAPTTLAATSILPTSANLSWTEVGTATAWEYVYGVSPLATPVGSGTATTSSTVNPISALTANTTYQFYVRSNCGSTWAGPFTFATPCNTTVAPFTEDFELATFPPSCWSKTASPTWIQSTSVSGYSVGTGSARANFYSTSSTTPFDLITMNFDVSALSSPSLVFDYAYATYTGGEADQLDIYYSTNSGSTYTLLLAMPGGTSGILNTGGTTSSTFVPLDTQWATQTLALPVGTTNVKFRATSAWGNDLYLDNVKVKGLEYNTTFNVDMSTAAGFVPGTDLVYLNGNFPGASWITPGDPTSILMSRVGTSLIYTKTLALAPATYEYKYFKNAGWAGGEYAGGTNRSATIAAPTTFNDTWGGSINWANLQWPGTGSINLGGNYDVYAQAYIPNGITAALGATTGLQSWIGYSTSNTDPSTWTNWVAAPFSSQSFDNDEFKVDLGASILTTGTYYYASRFQFGNMSYVYGGFSATNGGYWDGTTNISGVLTVNEVVTTKTLNLTAYLQGFWNGTGMNQAQDVDIDFNVWNKWTGTTVDTLSVYLADAASPYDLVFQAHTVNISTDGSMTITVPAAFSGSYYIALVHRSSIETWSADPVSFSGSTITYNFSTAASQAFGSNQIDLLGDGSVWGLFGGELYSSGGVLPADGYIDINDVNAIYNENVNASFGYMLEDITGDGFVDINDFNMVYNNNVNAVGLNTPIFPMKRPRNGKN